MSQSETFEAFKFENPSCKSIPMVFLDYGLITKHERDEVSLEKDGFTHLEKFITKILSNSKTC
jgi:hypothetical protein